MLNANRKKYGKPLITIGDETIYSFPSLQELSAKATDEDLRKTCGMGYRAKYLLETMKTLQSLGGENYLFDLRKKTDPIEVQEKLIQFCGVGRKVADCVALFSLRQDCAIPVDTHVWNIARRDYDSKNLLKEAKSTTPSIYHQTGDLFRSRFQQKPGWAHSVLFVAELPSFRPTLPADMVEEMESFRRTEKENKTAAKERKGN
jgi:N-glycosylase/DNA lyase